MKTLSVGIKSCVTNDLTLNFSKYSSDELLSRDPSALMQLQKLSDIRDTDMHKEGESLRVVSSLIDS
uniref:CSON011561 protein n=1 Tax=Culicoides sonorensis TaxID=179676 RepID=A0A336KKM9_CULSO